MTRRTTLNSLTIVIPAFNEEKSIGHTIEGCMAARKKLTEETAISDVEIVVVSDGSTDGTADIARSYGPVSVLACRHNHGYGAALKLGFEKGSGDLVGFLDADGTCDPHFFVDLCNLAIDGPADVVLGSRMHKESRMPPIRRLGNRMFAAVMSRFSGEKVTDIASGMRVIRREALSRLYPLPNGLHFTPAMSSKALLDDSMTIREIPMPYYEREGRSKLDIFKDGTRFFLTIGRIASLHFSLRLFGGIAMVLFIIALLYGAGPLHFYLTQH
ncbi:MAG: glycosyltransferase family 2 protein, partial [Deltaproteobacteria bacterium]|nr:glycosyltransferase family 2 protein [Deltaproteobacteria bacterium]